MSKKVKAFDNKRSRLIAKSVMTAMVVLLAVCSFAAAPAQADDRYHDRGGHDHRGRGYYDHYDHYDHYHHWHGYPAPRGYYQPAYAPPPPVVYAPPPQPAGINLIVPLHIR